MFSFLSFSLLFLFYFCFPKHKKDQKYLCYFSLFAFLVFQYWFALLSIFGLVFEKSKKILLCLLFPSILVLKFKNPKIFVVFSGFVKFVTEFIGLHDSVGAWLSPHIIQTTQVKGNDDDI
jgi:hypothetical protein